MSSPTIRRAGRKTCASCRKTLSVGELTTATVEYELPGGRNSIGDRRRSFNYVTVPAPYHAECWETELRFMATSRLRYLRELREEFPNHTPSAAMLAEIAELEAKVES